VNRKAEDVFFDEQMILIAKAKGGKSRYVPIVPELAQALRTPIGQRTVGYLFETHRATRYSPPTHPADSEGNGGAGTDHQAGISASPPALRGNDALRAGDADPFWGRFLINDGTTS